MPMFMVTSLKPMLSKSFLTSIILFSVLAARPDNAQAMKIKVDSEAAKAKYLEAQKFFKAEEYELALPLFEQAYYLSGKKASTILGFAQCQRMLKNYSSAITLFKEYLQTSKGKSEATRVNETLKILELQFAKAEELKKKKQAEQQKAEAEKKRQEEMRAKKLAEELAVPPPPAQINASEKEGLMSQTWFWVSVGLLVAGASAGGIALGMNTSQNAEVYEGSYNKILRP